MSKKTTPAWLMKRYMKLWDKFKDKRFLFEDVQKTLRKDNKFLSVVLSEMKRESWLTLGLNPEDARKRPYKLKLLEEVISKTTDKSFNAFREESNQTVHSVSINIGKTTSGRDTMWNQV